ncbi:MAG: hypothetical protein RJA70_3892, partial [Pseudomonadota bacterium]
RALSPRGDFAEDALVRELRSAVVRGQRERALQLLAQYDSAFSEVRPSDEVERLRARLQVTVASEADAGASRGTATERETEDGKSSADPAPGGSDRAE